MFLKEIIAYSFNLKISSSCIFFKQKILHSPQDNVKGLVSIDNTWDKWDTWTSTQRDYGHH